MDRSKVMARARATAVLLMLCVAVQARAEKFISFWALFENQPNIKEGGRANTIAVHPADSNQMFVASESGGLFKTTDRGLHWKHVDSLPVYFTQAVAYLPFTPNVLLVSAKEDYKTINGGGVWRSADGGVTWNQMTLEVPGSSPRLSAHGLSILPGAGNTVFVATSEGVFRSTDSGLTWTYHDVFSAGENKVFSVLATQAGIYAGGPGGVRIGNGNPLTWTMPVNDPGSVKDIHAFGRSPFATTSAYLVTESTQLFRTENGGTNWTRITSAPSGNGGCGGIAFIKARRRTLIEFLDLYYGDRCGLYQLPVPIVAGNPRHDGQWNQLWTEHGDTRDLAFTGNTPLLLGTDGGLHNTPDGGATWPFVGGGRLGGFNALQVTEVKGQTVRDGWITDLYFGTQDNDVWASNIWANVLGRHGAEGFFIDAERRVDTAADSVITFTACAGCQNRKSGRHLTGPVNWPNPPGNAGSPTFMKRNQYVQAVADSDPLDPGLAVTNDLAATWQQFALFPEEKRDRAQIGRAPEDRTKSSTIVYQAYRSNLLQAPWERASMLLRVERPGGTTAPGTVFYPAMTNFGGLGTARTEFAWYQIYGVDPGNAYHIIAPDVVNQRMMETKDGGETWTDMPALTALVTDNGRFTFRADLIGFNIGQIFPIVTAVSFSPQDPRLVLVGTMEGGIFVSGDNGVTWRKIPNTEPATYITSFFWKDTNTVYVSTYGRGLWRLNTVRIAIPGAFDELCGMCEVLDTGGGPERPPFDGSVHVFEGTVIGVRTQDKQLREVFVTPGSSVVYTGDQKDPQDDITITEYDGRSEYEPLPAHPKGWIAKGLVFQNGDVFTGTIYGDTEASLLPPVSDESYKGSTESPTKGKPYVRLTASAFKGIPAATPGELFELVATDFPAGAKFEVLIDGVLTKGDVTADGNGSFTVKRVAPEGHGYHLVDVRMVGGEVLDGSVLLVMHED